MDFESLSRSLLQNLEKEVMETVARINTKETEELHYMLAYHMGWVGEGAGPRAQGKRIRPLLVLLCAGSCGGLEMAALPAAASVEILHNFSLIHDDIEDNSPSRRGRPTLWKKWGLAQAINAGDALYTLAYTAMLGLNKRARPETTVRALGILQRTCVELTQGQYLDISFESRLTVSETEYWRMIGGKTASLIAACTELGALTAGAAEERQAHYREFGRHLGLAFQVQDDVLGIWGDQAVTGKSSASDLIAGKKSLPVIFGLEKESGFKTRWEAGPISEDDAGEAAALLEATGAKTYVEEQARRMTDKALEHLEAAGPRGDTGKALEDLAAMLLKRNI